MKLDPENLAEMIVTTIVKAMDGPRVAGRLDTARGAHRAAGNEAVCQILRHVSGWQIL